MTPSELTDHLQRLALALPGAEPGLSCAGTALECPTVTVKGKAFLFLGRVLRLRLAASLDEATALADAGVNVGRHGWVDVRQSEPVPPALLPALERWVAESHASFASPPQKPRR